MMRLRLSALVLAISTSVILTACGDKPSDDKDAGRSGSPFADDASVFPALSLAPEQTVCAPHFCALHEPPIYIVKQVGNDLIIGGGRDPIYRVGANGRPIGTIGRRGTAAGQYTSPMAADIDEQGNMTVLDMSNNGLRSITYDPEGKPIATVRVPVPKPPETVLGFTLSGSDIYYLSGHNSTPTDSQNFSLSRVFPDTKQIAPVAHARTTVAFSNDGGILNRLFTPLPLVAIHRNGTIYLSDGSEYAIRKVDPNGTVVSTIKVDAQPARVAPADVTAAAATLDSASADEAVRQAPTVFPVLSSIRVLSDETLWVRRYTRTINDSARWDAFSAEGKPIGTVTLSNAADIRAGNAGRILVVDKDSLNYPMIRWMSVRTAAK
jgi:hypothetical protein